MEELATLEPDQLRNVTGPDASQPRPACTGRIERRRDDQGGLVVKRARSGDRADLRREAEVMRAVADTPLVRLVELRDLPDVTELVLRDTGGPSLAASLRDPETRPSVALDRLAAACEAVARLHAAGWAHGRISTDHVVLTPRGRVRLCSLRAAQPIDLDPATARRDRVALLRMVDDWALPGATGRPPTDLRSRMVRARLARHTRRLPDDPDPLVLARILRRCRSRPRPGMWAVAISAVVAVTVGLAATQVPRRVTAHSGAGTATSRDVSTTASPTTASCDATVEGTGIVKVDIDGDGCPEAVTTAGNVVTVGSRRFRVGSAGDVVAVGDWDCDGRATAAVLHPSSGEVHTFGDWATDARSAASTAVGTVDGAVSIAAVPTGCGPPVATLSDGTTTRVALR